MPQDRSSRRKRSRSYSPVPSKHKRSWQNDEPKRHGNGPQRSPSPLRGKKQSNFKSSPAYSNKRDRPDSPLSRGPPRRSPSPLPRKRPVSRSPDTGRRGPSPRPRPMRDAPPPQRDSRDSRPVASSSRTGPSVSRQRSISPRPIKKIGNDRNKDSYYSKRTPSPESRYLGKKKSRLSSLSPPPQPAPAPSFSHRNSSSKPNISVNVKKSSGSSNMDRPRSPLPPSSGSGSRGDSMMQQRKVSAPSKKKYSRITLNKRFTTEDQDPFRLEENVTIAILRNPNVEPSEEVTVKRVFDSSVFKMIHRKTEGRKPIFDREEIKVWRHDENLVDDPDFERRLVRVKSSSQKGKPTSDSLSRMSPDVIRKAFGLQVGARSKSRSPHREPQIRLDPKPDPRYESKYRKQIEKEKHRGGHMDEGNRRDVVSGGSLERMEDRRRPVGEEGRRAPGEYDLRQALERRRSDREDGGGFRIEVRQDEMRRSPGDPYYRKEQRGHQGHQDFSRRLSVDDGGDGGGRSVVFGSGGGGGERYESLSPDRDGMRWEDRGRPFRGKGRGRGRGRVMRGRRYERSPDPRGGGDFRSRDRERSAERRPRFSNSPSNNRGWRGNRGRGRGRGRDFNSPYRAEIVNPSEIDDSFKYTQHDDRDVSPKAFRARGRGRGRGRFPARSFGSNSFRGTDRGGYRGRVFRGKSFGSLGNRDRRSPDRGRDRSADREWKHDMYDSLQGEEEQPHSTTLSA